jgi:hypothetical protein
MSVPTQISIAPPVDLRAYLPLELQFLQVVYVTDIQFLLSFSSRGPRIPNNIKSLISNQIPTWGAQPGNEGSAKATWLG